jgi:hypothetical protein
MKILKQNALEIIKDYQQTQRLIEYRDFLENHLIKKKAGIIK